ncbi:unnamed protein product [Mesocestoides corti]|uniref:Rubicon Homology domain-containing protein n=1 Tax=Mesocestoides corti TaxID=53468 RepID=A0A158QVI7_MESCO|nr:unnamed protein product [Mesocestoides corti]
MNTRIDTLKGVNGTRLASESRYFLHHRIPDHLKVSHSQEPSKGNLHEPSKTESKLPRIGSSLDEMKADKPVGLRLVKSSFDFMLHSMMSGGWLYISETVNLDVNGHKMIQATCSKYWGRCEACRQTVHSTKYFYCKNCPVVCHKSKVCWDNFKRVCPASDTKISGWGESKNSIAFGTAPPKKLRRPHLDVQYVYLGGSVSTQENGCAECGRVLQANMGYMCGEAGRKTEDGDTKSDTKWGRLRNFIRRTFRSRDKKASRPRPEVQEAKKVLLCHLTRKQYCENCHWGDTWYIPGNMFLLNDFERHPVSRSAYLKLRVLWDTEIIKTPSYWHKDNEKALKVFQIRKKLKAMSAYFSVCDDAQAIKEVVDVSPA